MVDQRCRDATGLHRRRRDEHDRLPRRKRTALFLALAPVLLAFGLGAQEAPHEAPQKAPRDMAPSSPFAEAPSGSSYQDFAVHIFRKPRQSWPGFGIYLGEGRVLTAAHVVGHPTQGNPSVEIAGRILEASVVREGEFETVDLTLLRVDPLMLPASLGLRLMPLCEAPPRAGQPVVVATPEALSTSHILSPKALPPNLRESHFDTLIADVATTGNSGSGVFDPVNRCLMGIMSRKIQIATVGKQDLGGKPNMVDLAKYFVPAQQIGPFIGSRSK
jgi:hypothetical protein